MTVSRKEDECAVVNTLVVDASAGTITILAGDGGPSLTCCFMTESPQTLSGLGVLAQCIARDNEKRPQDVLEDPPTE